MAKRAKTLSNDEILAAINAARDESNSADATELVSDRADAMDRYYGRPYGDEVEGRSAVVSRDISDTVDWIMPSLVRVFGGSDAVVMFNPVGPEDEEQAQQETDYVNYVVTQENPWFLVGHDWFKDALLLRNGYVKFYWEEYTEPKYSTYRNLSVDELPMVVDAETEVVEKRENDEGGFDVKVRKYETGGQVCIEAVPPEEILVDRNCRGSIQTAAYVEHRPRKTRSDLIEMGLPKDFVEGLSAFSEDGRYNADSLARSHDASDEGISSYARDQDAVDYREVYIRLDVDGDGVSELRRIVVCGNQIVPGREWNTEADSIPFASLTPNRVPHRHVGRSIADEIEDLARIKTTLWRQLLDNVYLTNNQRTVVNGNVNLSDLLVSRPGGIIRTSGTPGMDVVPMVTQPIVGQVAPVLEMVDFVKEFRTGVGRSAQGLDADTLKQSTKGAYVAAIGQANQKIEMIARMFAETGVKDLFIGVHGLLIKNQDKEKVARLRNTWIPVNPSEWNERYDLTVSVGLGTGTAEEQIQKVNALANAQGQLAAMGMVGPEEAYANFEVLCKALGFKNPSKFAKDPSSEEFKAAMANQVPPKDPLVAAKEIEVQGRVQVEGAKAQAEQPFKAAEFELRKYEIDRNAELERERLAIEAQNAQADRETKEAVAQLQARVDLTVADMRNQMAQVGQMVKVIGDAQNRMALGGPMASQVVDVGEDGSPAPSPNVSDAFGALNQTLMAIADGQRQLAEAQGQMTELLSKPRKIAIQRDDKGLAVGATSKVS